MCVVRVGVCVCGEGGVCVCGEGGVSLTVTHPQIIRLSSSTISRPPSRKRV